MIKAALDENPDPFKGPLFDSNTPGDILERMMAVTKGVCQVTRNLDGMLVGDCENCYKRLGRGCPAATYIRSKDGHLRTSLENKRKVPAKSNGDPIRMAARGNITGMYESGPPTKNQKL